MTKHCLLATTFLACACGGRLESLASAQQGLGYFWAEAGPAWTMNADLDEFADVPLSGGELDFNTGFRFTAAGGYHITDWLAAEFESGVIYNSVDAVHSPGVSTSGNASMSQVPFLVNVVLSLPNRTRVVPYVGGGVGGALSLFYADRFELTHPSTGTTGADGSFSDFVFAYQGFAGVRYDFTDDMSLGLSYRYFASNSVKWKPEVVYGTAGTIRAGPFQNQSVALAFTFRF